MTVATLAAAMPVHEIIHGDVRAYSLFVWGHDNLARVGRSVRVYAAAMDEPPDLDEIEACVERAWLLPVHTDPKADPEYELRREPVADAWPVTGVFEVDFP